MKNNKKKTNENKDKFIKSESNCIYPSSKLMLSVLQKEYEYDLNKLNSLYSRTGIMIALTGLILSQVILRLVDNTTFKNIVSHFKMKVFTPSEVIYILCLSIGSALLAISVFHFIRSILASKYQTLDTGEGFSKNVCHSNEDEIAMFLMDNYKEILCNNKKVLNKKFNSFKYGIIFLVISVFGYAVLTTLYLILT